MLYKFNEFNEFKDRESYGRSKPLSEDEFLKLFKENCKNFSNNLLSNSRKEVIKK